MVRTTSSSLVSALVVLFALTGCPGKLASSPTDSCKSYFAALTGYYERCEILPNRGVPARARLEDACAHQVVAPGASNWAARLDRCTSEILAASCSDTIACLSEVTTGDLADGAPCGEGFQCKSGRCEKPRTTACGVCASPLGGRSPVGRPCEYSADCIEGAACHVSNEGAKCIAIELAQAGESCGVSSDALTRCAKGLHCLLARDSDRAGTCRAPVGVGGECRSRLDCTDGLACIDGHCVARLPEGSGCELSERFHCAKGLACDGTCKKVIWAQTGEACDLVTRWCERGDCVGTTTGPARCVDQLHEGAACDDGIEGSPRCEPPARCIEGKCTVVDPAACR